MKLNVVAALGLSMALLAGPHAHAQAVCPALAAFTARDGREPAERVMRQVSRVSEALTWSGGLRVNTDGAANAYHPTLVYRRADGPLTSLCNGFAVVLADGARLTALNTPCRTLTDYYVRVRDNDWQVASDFRLDFFAIARRPESDGRYQLCVQNEGPHSGYFVSTTSMIADAAQDVCSAARYVDSSAIPFITLPSRNTDFREAGARPGDVALVHRRVDGQDRWVVAVVADYGNSMELGEGSLALHRGIGNEMRPGRLRGIADGVTTFLFPDRAAPTPLTAESLAGLEADLLAALGGAEVAGACVEAHNAQ